MNETDNELGIRRQRASALNHKIRLEVASQMLKFGTALRKEQIKERESIIKPAFGDGRGWEGWNSPGSTVIYPSNIREDEKHPIGVGNIWGALAIGFIIGFYLGWGFA